MGNKASQDALLPVSPVVFHMLLALSDGEKHGYGIMKSVEDDTGGEMTIPLGTLYGSIRRMTSAGLIEEMEERPDPDVDDERRRYYRLTSLGRQVLEAETRRLAKLVSIAQAKRIGGATGG